MKLIFFGTGLLAVPVLERLARSRHTVVGCVTQPDRPRGRGQKLRPSPVKATALVRRLPLLTPERLDDALVLELCKVAPDVGVVVDYGTLLPRAVLAVPPRGMLGVHPSLLPKYRGAAPVQRAILHGDEMTGVTIFRLTGQMDSGDVLLQDMTAIRADETAVELRDRLAAQGGELLVRALDLLERGQVQWHPQDHSAATQATKLTKADSRLDWTLPAPILVNRIRGLQPWPGAATQWGRKSLQLCRARLAVGCTTALPGTVLEITKEGWLIAANDGGIVVTAVRPEGGREMPAADFCRGHALRVGDQLG